MKRLLLMRHAKSSWAGQGVADFDRPLSPRGAAAASAMGEYMARQHLFPDLVLCSAARRARETCERVVQSLGSVEVMVEAALYSADTSEWFDRLRLLPASAVLVLVIGHNPSLQALALELADTEASAPGLLQLQIKFPTGALAAFRVGETVWPRLAPASCAFDFLIRPKDISPQSVSD
ncbi:MAG: histidine phosphatase family protein [Alphaproteobacteria bacterium]|nr:histidine phosphatase family protein [Alphaproteobacteria bacterium]